MERRSYKDYLPEEEFEIKKPKGIKVGSKVVIKGRHQISMVSNFGVFGSNDLTGAVVTDEHKFPMSEFNAEDEFKVGRYVTNDNVYEVIGLSKTGNAVKVKMANKDVLIFKKCLEVVE